MIFRYTENANCSCGKAAKFEVGDDIKSLYFCNDCMRMLASAYMGTNKVKNKITTKKPSNIFKDLGDLSFEHNGQNIIVDPFANKDYTPSLYFRNTKKYISFSWDDLLAIAINLGICE